MASGKYENTNEMFLKLVKLNDEILKILTENIEEIEMISIYEVSTK